MTNNNDEFGPDSAAAMMGVGPAQLELLVQLAQLERSSGKYELALETLQVLVDIAPFFKKGRLLLADVYTDLGDEARAEVHREFSKGLEE